MPTNYPGSLDAFPNPDPTDLLNDPANPHASQHSNINDATEAIEAKLGIGASTPSTVDHVLKVTGSGQTAYGTVPATAGATRSATRIVAASNALQASKDAADYVCDGTADQSEINAAIAAVPSGGGIVHLTEGDFHISGSIVMNKSGVTLEGSGIGTPWDWSPLATGTRLRYQSGLTGSMIAAHRTDASFPVAGVTIQHMNLDGLDSGSAITGILFRAHVSAMFRVHVRRMSGHGVRVAGYGPGDPNGKWGTYDTVLSHLVLGQNGLSGLFCDAFAEDLQIASSVFLHNGEDGFRSQGSSNQIVNSHMYSNERNGIRVHSGAARVRFANCKIEHSHQHGVLFEGDAAMIQASGIHQNGSGASNTYSSIYVNTSNVIVAANSIGHATGEGSSVTKHGIYANTGSSGLAAANYIYGSFLTSPVSINSSNFELRGNGPNIADVN